MTRREGPGERLEIQQLYAVSDLGGLGQLIGMTSSVADPRGGGDVLALDKDTHDPLRIAADGRVEHLLVR